ncbi:MAG: XRE family transcriptional regulator [Bacteroidaceae bacterium]|nr:XRE family transcriptional regulator [Bacteroidaceae bacterium]
MEKPIGILIKEELERQERTVTWFAKKLNCHRVNVYDIFNRENIDTQLLIRISKVLNKNFLRVLADDFDNITEGDM